MLTKKEKRDIHIFLHFCLCKINIPNLELLVAEAVKEPFIPEHVDEAVAQGAAIAAASLLSPEVDLAPIELQNITPFSLAGLIYLLEKNLVTCILMFDIGRMPIHAEQKDKEQRHFPFFNKSALPSVWWCAGWFHCR